MDNEFRDKIITEVRPGKDDYEISMGGSCFWVDRKWNVEPRIGDTVRFYGRGFGYPIRGIFINGVKCFYRTPGEEGQHQKALSDKRNEDMRGDFEKKKPELDAAYNDLPPEFKKRIDKFRETNPDFRWQFEACEMSCCTDALNIATKLKSVEEIEKWQELPHEEQIKRVVIYDGHNGNSFGCAVGLAKAWLQDPKSVILMHGALTPLTGCEDYGCPHPFKIEDEAKDSA